MCTLVNWGRGFSYNKKHVKYCMPKVNGKQFDVRLFMQRTVFRYMILVEDGFFPELLWVSLHLSHPLQQIPTAPFSVAIQSKYQLVRGGEESKAHPETLYS